ncbi:MAG TPA: lipid II flippase MurJ [Alphaproteobacteria bacterium]
MTALVKSFLGRLPTSTVRFSFIVVPVIIALSKLLGLVREGLLTKFFGLGPGLDLFILFTTLPNYAMGYVLGPFSVAFYASLAMPGNAAWALLRRLFPWLFYGGLIGGLLAFVAALIIEPRMDMIGLSVGAYAAIAATCAATIPLAVLIGAAVCLLHANKGHTTAVLLTVVQPWGFVLLLLSLDALFEGGIFGPIGLSYTLSFLLALAVAYWCVDRSDSQMESTPENQTAAIKSFRGYLGLATVETTGFFANQLLTMFFAGLSGVGGIAANGLAVRVMLTPLTLMVTPLSPILQNLYRRSDEMRRRWIFALAYISILLLIFSSMIVIVYFGDEVIRLFFQHGAFNAEDTARVVALLIPYCVYAMFIASNQLCAAVAFVSGNGKFYTFTMLTNYGVSNLLKIPMLAQFGLEGVIWAAAAAEGAAALANLWRQLFRRADMAHSGEAQ